MREMVKLREIKLLLHDAWTYYGQPIDTEQLGMMAEDLMDFEPAALSRAIRQWRRTPPERGHRPRAPMPCELIAIVDPQVTLDEEADAIASNIVACVASCGRTQPARAEDKLGYRAWQVVIARGGWHGLCVSMPEGASPAIYAQLRDLARATLKRDPVGLSPAERVIAGQQDKPLLSAAGQDVVTKIADAWSAW